MDAMTDAVTTAATAANNSVVSAAPPTSTAAQTPTDVTMSNESNESDSRATLAAAVLGFFIITLDVVVVNVALPSIRHDLGGGVTGLQQQRALSAFGTGLVFLPMMLIGAVLTPLSARITEKIGRKAVTVAGLALMTIGLAVLGVLPSTTPLWLLAVLMMFVGVGAPPSHCRAPHCCSTLSPTSARHRLGVPTPAAKSAVHSLSPSSVACCPGLRSSCEASTPACCSPLPSWPSPQSPRCSSTPTLVPEPRHDRLDNPPGRPPQHNR